MSVRLFTLASVLVAAAGVRAVAQTAPAVPTQQVAAGASITLADLERRALEIHPTITAAAARLEAEQARARQAGTWPNPVIGFSAEELGSRERDPRGEYGVFAEQTVPLGGKLKLSRTVGERAAARAEAAFAWQRARVVSTVRTAFYDVLVLERRIEVLDRLAGLVSEAVGVSAQLFNVGAADRPDVLEAEVEARRVQLDVIAARNRVFAARQRLAAVVGDSSIAGRPLAGSADDAIPELERDASLRRLLDESPEVRTARADLEGARAITLAARRETSPDLFLRGGAAYNREPGERSGDALGWQGRIEAGVSVPLFNRNRAGIAAARADETRLEAELQRRELSLRAMFAGEFATYLTAVRESEAYRVEILPRAEEAYRLYLARYREMAAAYPQVLVAQRRLLELSSEYLQRVEAGWQSAVRLQGLLAGDGLDQAGRGEGGEDMTRAIGRGGQQ
jgi:cobalt-zinc-cadmium efflux system outer membrane protein